ncbi:MAG: putative zinc-binding peptidase [Ancalomicrobiaceae bacterium]|nr:putative zinc-binding peptidase [Ancalomicrobiaceae bacterium]
MRLFQCQSCGNAVHFDNTTCVECGHRLGYLPDRCIVTAVEPAADGWHALADRSRLYLFCGNAEIAGCNWLMPAADGPGLCLCCRHNRLVPDLSNPGHAEAWRRVEAAKRWLFYSLTRWRLPLPDPLTDPRNGLVFDVLADGTGADGRVKPVLTGHDAGVITVAVAEADDAEREARRHAMGEPYRTLLGHFRHEIGHYYWDRLVRDGGLLGDCRANFGDDRDDYAAALRRYYAWGPPANWRDRYISAYAASHPWEDFAETWAHYTHIVDALETAHAFGLVVRPRGPGGAALAAAIDFDPYRQGAVPDLVAAWVPVTVALNALNRSLGQPDLYPFVLPEAVTAKLAFVHTLVRAAGRI